MIYHLCKRKPTTFSTHIPHCPLLFVSTSSTSSFFPSTSLHRYSPPPPPPLSFASSSFCLPCWRKKKAPSRSLSRLRMAFISPIYWPSIPPALLWGGRGHPKCCVTATFSFYSTSVSFKLCDTTWSRCTPRGLHRGLLFLFFFFATILIACFFFFFYLLNFSFILYMFTLACVKDVTAQPRPSPSTLLTQPVLAL